MMSLRSLLSCDDGMLASKVSFFSLLFSPRIFKITVGFPSDFFPDIVTCIKNKYLRKLQKRRIRTQLLYLSGLPAYLTLFVVSVTLDSFPGTGIPSLVFSQPEVL